MENKAAVRALADEKAVNLEYWETVTPKSSFQPEKQLMLAVLKDAMVIYKRRIYLENGLFKEAETWFFDRERDGLFSFETICAVLGLSSENIRKNLLACKLNGPSLLIDTGPPPRSDGLLI